MSVVIFSFTVTCVRTQTIYMHVQNLPIFAMKWPCRSYEQRSKGTKKFYVHPCHDNSQCHALLRAGSQDIYMQCKLLLYQPSSKSFVGYWLVQLWNIMPSTQNSPVVSVAALWGSFSWKFTLFSPHVHAKFCVLHAFLNTLYAPSKNFEKRLLALSCLSVRPHGTTRFPLDGLSWNFIFEDFSKICRENSSFIKIWQKYRVLYMYIQYISLNSWQSEKFFEQNL
jgi:hypothetical protein